MSLRAVDKYLVDIKWSTYATF